MKEKPMPEHVSAEVVEATWMRMAQTPVSRVPALVNSFKKAQPVIMVQFSAPDETLFNLYEKEFIFYVGMVSWQMMRHHKSRLRRVTMKTLEAAMDENLNLLDKLMEDTEPTFSAPRNLWSKITLSWRCFVISLKPSWKRMRILRNLASGANSKAWLLCTSRLDWTR